MIEDILKIREQIGRTPLVRLEHFPGFNLFAKLEYTNFSGSIKDRAANNILYHAIKENKIREGTIVIESSSGNFGISTALQCNRLGVDFCAVVDPQISEINLKMLRLFASRVIMVDQPDETGGFLLNRIRKVKELVEITDNSYWTNQYENPNNFLGYAGLADEINCAFSSLDYLFVPTSSCGTVVGLTRFVKQQFPDLVVVAVDIEGSMIFSDKKCKRYIPGLGAGRKAAFMEGAPVDEVMILTHEEIISGCRDLLNSHSVFAGGSSGAAYFAACKFMNGRKWQGSSPNALIICPDRGIPYIDTIYNDAWVTKILEEKTMNELMEKVG